MKSYIDNSLAPVAMIIASPKYQITGSTAINILVIKVAHPCHLQGVLRHVHHVCAAVVRYADGSVLDTTATDIRRGELLPASERGAHFGHVVYLVQVGLDACRCLCCVKPG
ncbi:MAG: hypothetical protein II495_01785, partial [Paludibacteraceae bacterium]|nr:hypothetical protein [Paludibacteraceae bacterium]